MKTLFSADRRLLVVFALVFTLGVLSHATPVGFEPVESTGLALGEPQRISTAGNMTLERQELFFERQKMIAYRIRVSRSSATMRVLASPRVVRLDKLFEPPNGNFLAINGGFYDQQSNPMGLVVSRGKELSKQSKSGGSGIVESRDGEISILHRSDYKAGADEALQSIDRIVAEGRSLVRQRTHASGAARTVIVRGEKHLWAIVVVSENSIQKKGGVMNLGSTSEGLPLWATARYLLETTDVVDALNLDGGISTQVIARVGDRRLEIRGVSGTINGILIE